MPDTAEPVISGFIIYSTEEPRGNERSFISGEHTINVKQVRTFELAVNNVSKYTLLTFLNYSLRKQMTMKGYSEIFNSGKYIKWDTKMKDKMGHCIVTYGYNTKFLELESGYFLRADSSKRIVHSDTVYDFIAKFWKYR
jgi:hypothetical protein